ncbi:receptor expression-enhancing 3-like protein [Labeo rohita]|uniref:Receptor expression-enhancing protein n=1 Tax=Labeo rohita TaxID=84645 RepID=A0A498NEI3_LABRO|nr:receptor expression-enhancing 3-like protein [Labeo rohita]
MLFNRKQQCLEVRLVFGNLYPAYYSYKAVKTKNVKEYDPPCESQSYILRKKISAGVTLKCYFSQQPKRSTLREKITAGGFRLTVCHGAAAFLRLMQRIDLSQTAEGKEVRWMMYWIVFALFTVVETATDLTIAWFPLYYEIKIAFVIWLLSPYTRGASLIYRKALHPLLTSKERGQGAITEKLRSFSMHDLTQISQDDAYSSYSSNPARRAIMDQPDGAEYYRDDDDGSDDDGKPVYSEDEAVSHHGLRRSQTVKITRSKLRKDPRYGSLKIKGRKRPALNAMTYSSVDN